MTFRVFTLILLILRHIQKQKQKILTQSIGKIKNI